MDLYFSHLQEAVDNKEACVVHAQQEQTRLEQELEDEKTLLKNCQKDLESKKKENKELKTALEVVVNSSFE